MAAKTARPGRTLVVFGLCVLVLFGLVALAGTWKPALGLDLQGGQRITLRAKDDGVSQTALKEAADIINSRVNGSGVSEAEVSTQGDTNIVVEIPGQSNQALVDVVQRQAQLRFRLVACTSQDPSACTAGGGTTPDGSLPGLTPPASGSDGAVNRTAPDGLRLEDKDKQPKRSSSPSPTTSPAASPTGSPTAEPSGEPGTRAGDVKGALAWTLAPPASWQTKFQQTTCPLDAKARNAEDFDAPDQPLVTCDDQGIKYLLSAAVIEGRDLADADAGQEVNSLEWQVSLTLDDQGKDAFTQVSQALAPRGGALHGEQFAIVLDGNVISAPTMDAVISNGKASISGDFSEESADSLATSLRYGALPVAFEDNPKNDTIGPSLAGNQLHAGIWAGVVGLVIVMLYCLAYYRGLGIVVIASLVVAAVVTYGLVLLLSKGAGFTVSLPGIAGLIVAVGITADSFIVFFERIRDEMRDGKSMRVAVEAGWTRARNTCLAADTVSLLAAVVLYIFAIDEVRGFAFTLGLVTLIDLVVFFWFTKPLVSTLGRLAFFNQGHRLSGLDAENLGIDRLPGVATGGAR